MRSPVSCGGARGCRTPQEVTVIIPRRIPLHNDEPRTNGFGLGWSRAAEALAAHVPSDEIKRIWLFPKLRRDEREWGTAVAALEAETDRLTIFTARYMLVTRGKAKGQGKVEVSEIGTSSSLVIEEVLRGVHERASEAEPPVEIDPEIWYGGEDDESTAQG